MVPSSAPVAALLLAWLAHSCLCSSYGPPSEYGGALAPSTPFNTPASGSGPLQQPSGSLYFAAPLSVYPQTTFVGNGGPSPSATYDYLTVANMTVPTVEQLHLALHIYTSEPSSGQSPNPLLQEVVYMDLQTGQFVTAEGNLNFSTQTQVYNYTTYGPNLVEYADYVALLNSTLTRVQGLAKGRQYGSPGDSRLDSLVSFLQAAQQNVSNPSTINNGTKPTELYLPTNCILEQDANYKGSSVSGILTPASGSTQTANDCCKKCRDNSACNVFTYCPLQMGCPYGDNQTFPYQGCQLKQQPGTSLSPLYTAPAYSRGPPTPFSSGRT